MNCHDALLLLEFARPGATELEASDIAALERHLVDCTACRAFAQMERANTDRLASAFNRTPATTLLPENLRKQIAQKQHRWQLLAMSKVALAIGFAGTVYWAIPGPWFDPNSILNILQSQVANADGAAEWLANQDSRFRFPPRFRPGNLVLFEKRDYHRVHAPILTFIHGNSMARVAVLTEKQFRNLPDYPAGPVASNSSASILILRDPDVPGVVYLVEVINGSIESFREEAPPAT